MKKKIIYGLLFAVAMVTASSSFVSCKDYEGDDYALLKEKNASLEDWVKAQLAAIKQCNCDPSKYVLLSDLNSRGYITNADLAGYVKNADLADYLKSSDLDGYAKTSDLNGYVKTSDLVSQINTNSQTIIDIITAAGFSKDVDLSGYAKTSDLAGFLKASDLAGYAKTSDLEGLLRAADLVQLGDSVKKAYTWALYSYTRLINQGDSLKNIYDSLGVVRQDAYDSIAKVRQEALDNFATAKKLADSAIVLANAALDSAALNTTRIADLDKAMKEADQKLQDQIDTLKDRVAATEKDIQNIFGTLKKQITSIEIQGTYNPVFGTFGLPASIQSNVLAAFYGTAENDVKFPAYQKKFYVNGESWISKAEWDAMGLENVFEASAGDPLIAEEGNAGTLYVTVNPSNVDFDGTDFTLRSSDNKVSKVQLTPLKPSTEQLTFGYTRANSDNGFYEMQATVDIDDAASLAPKFDVKSVGSSIIQTLKDVKATAVAIKNDPGHNFNGGKALIKDLAKVVAEVYANSSDILPRLGVQANWVDGDVAKSVTSKYEVAATAIKPLGFSTLSKYWSLNDISYTPNHTFIKYIDGEAIDAEIYDIIMENLKLDLDLNLGIDLEFTELHVHYEPLADGEGKVLVDVPTYYLRPGQSQFIFDNIGGRYELLACNDDGSLKKNPDGTYVTTGIYYVLPSNEWWNYFTQEGDTYTYIYKNDKDDPDFMVLDLTDYTNALLEGIYNDVEHELQKFNSQVAKVNDINNLEGKAEEAINDAINGMGINIYTSLTDFVNNYINKANDIIWRLNHYSNKALDWLINDPDRYVQPMLFSVNKKNELSVVGRSRFSASVASAGDVIALKPTTITLETVAPAFKKHIAISNVWNKNGKNAVYDKDAAAKAVMDAANEAIGATEVIDGGTQKGINALKAFKVPANASGMTLEIVYTAMGYDGKIAGKKFYIRVK